MNFIDFMKFISCINFYKFYKFMRLRFYQLCKCTRNTSRPLLCTRKCTRNTSRPGYVLVNVLVTRADS